MSDRFADRVAIVTGSTRGIGAEIAQRLAREGASVVICGRSVDPGEATVERIRDGGGTAEFVQTDLRDPSAIAALVDATVDTFGGLDVLVNNAGVETYTGAGEATLEEWDLVMETDLRAVWLASKEALQSMDSGAIVNVSSVHARATVPSIFPYNVANAGIESMTRAMALDVGPQIRVNAVAPGLIAIERTTGDMSDEQRAQFERVTPVGRLGDPEDIAAAVAYLASDEAGFVTGTTLTVDGGRTAVLDDHALPDYSEPDG